MRIFALLIRVAFSLALAQVACGQSVEKKSEPLLAYLPEETQVLVCVPGSTLLSHVKAETNESFYGFIGGHALSTLVPYDSRKPIPPEDGKLFAPMTSLCSHPKDESKFLIA